MSFKRHYYFSFGMLRHCNKINNYRSKYFWFKDPTFSIINNNITIYGLLDQFTILPKKSKRCFSPLQNSQCKENAFTETFRIRVRTQFRTSTFHFHTQFQPKQVLKTKLHSTICFKWCLFFKKGYFQGGKVSHNDPNVCIYSLCCIDIQFMKCVF